jgi:hypothetical protein
VRAFEENVCARHPPFPTPPAQIGKPLKEEDKDKEDTEFDVGAFE